MVYLSFNVYYYNYFLFLGAIARTNAFYGQGTGPILRDNVGCTGQETQLRDCRFFTPDSYDYHYEDAGVHCHIIGTCTHKFMICLHSIYNIMYCINVELC